MCNITRLLWLGVLLLANLGLPASSRAGEVHLALIEGQNEQALRLLTANPALAKEKDHQQNKPLHLAALKGADELVKHLISIGAEVNPRNKFGQTPLHRAMVGGSFTTVKLLIDAKAEVNGRDNQGLTPLHVAAQRKHADIVRLLLEKKAELDAPDAFRRRPLHMGIMGSHAAVVGEMVKAGADYKHIDSNGNNYLLLAAGGGNPELVTLFLDLKLEINSVNRQKYSAAHFAAQNGHVEVLEVLDKRGADLALKSSQGRTPLDLVKVISPPFRMQRHDEVQDFLTKWHARQTNATPATVIQP
jgi:ankyrin repeat protein